MKNIRIFLSENIPFLVVKFSIYLNRRVFVMYSRGATAERFTDKSENDRDAVFSHAYIKTDFG